jgi:hypothetical protein
MDGDDDGTLMLVDANGMSAKAKWDALQQDDAEALYIQYLSDADADADADADPDAEDDADAEDDDLHMLVSARDGSILSTAQSPHNLRYTHSRTGQVHLCRLRGTRDNATFDTGMQWCWVPNLIVTAARPSTCQWLLWVTGPVDNARFDKPGTWNCHDKLRDQVPRRLQRLQGSADSTAKYFDADKDPNVMVRTFTQNGVPCTWTFFMTGPQRTPLFRSDVPFNAHMILHQPSRAAADETDVDILLRNKELVVDMELDPAWPRMDHIRTLQVRHAELGMVVCATQSAPQGTWDVRMDTNFGTDVWKEQRLVAIMQGVLTPAVPLTQALVLDSSYEWALLWLLRLQTVAHAAPWRLLALHEGACTP